MQQKKCFTVIHMDTHTHTLFHSGRTLVFDRRTFPVLRLTASWTDDHFVGQSSAVGQPTRPTQPFILTGSINE